MTASYWSKIAFFLIPCVFGARVEDDPIGISVSPISLAPENKVLGLSCGVDRKMMPVQPIYGFAYSRLDTIHALEG